MVLQSIVNALNPLTTAHVNMSSADAEETRYQEEVAAVKKWWTDSRWRYTKRPFTAEQIVQKRGNLKMTYANNEISKKLWNIVEDRFKVGGAAGICKPHQHH